MAQSEVLQRQHQEELDRLSAQLRDVGDERRRGGFLRFFACHLVSWAAAWLCTKILQCNTLSRSS
jgi:hypothetical protein